MRIVALNKPILFLLDRPDVGPLTLRVLKSSGEETTTINFNLTAGVYLKELIFTQHGSSLVIIEDGTAQIAQHVLAGNPDRVLYYQAPGYHTGLEIPWSLWRLDINTVRASGIMVELQQGFYQLQLPNDLQENNYVLTISNPEGQVEKRPVSWGREVGSFQVLYVDHINMGCDLTSGCSTDFCGVIRI